MIYLIVCGLAIGLLWILERRERERHDSSRFRKIANEHDVRQMMDLHPAMRGQWNPPKDGTRLRK